MRNLSKNNDNNLLINNISTTINISTSPFSLPKDDIFDYLFTSIQAQKALDSAWLEMESSAILLILMGNGFSLAAIMTLGLDGFSQYSKSMFTDYTVSELKMDELLIGGIGGIIKNLINAGTYDTSKILSASLKGAYDGAADAYNLFNGSSIGVKTLESFVSPELLFGNINAIQDILSSLPRNILAGAIFDMSEIFHSAGVMEPSNSTEEDTGLIGDAL